MPNVGESVYEPDSDTVYALTEDYAGGRIETGPAGTGNYCFFYGEATGSASDFTEEEFEELSAVCVEVVEEV